MMRNTSEMPELLQFQAHCWHPIMQTKHLENAGNHSSRDTSFEGVGELLQIQEKIWNYIKNFWRSVLPTNFSNTFLSTLELFAKNAEEINLYSSKVKPNKPMNCKVYCTQKFLWICIISYLTPPYNACDLWNDVLGIDLMKETVSKRCLRKFMSAYIPTIQTAQFFKP